MLAGVGWEGSAGLVYSLVCAMVGISWGGVSGSGVWTGSTEVLFSSACVGVWVGWADSAGLVFGSVCSDSARLTIGLVFSSICGGGCLGLARVVGLGAGSSVPPASGCFGFLY